MSNPPADWTHAQPQALDYLGFALGQVRCLPVHAHQDASGPHEVRFACLESFLMNVRLITEYLVHPRQQAPKRAPADWQPKDWHATDLVEDWSCPDSEAVRVLDGIWELASQHVAHLSRKRTPVDPAEPEDLSLARLQSLADACLSIATEFATQLGDDVSAQVFRLDLGMKP